MKSGIEYMTFLADWYPKNSSKGVGFFQLVVELQEIFHLCCSNVIPRYGNA
jgi:deoxyhypusine synthase